MQHSIAQKSKREIFSVSKLNQVARLLLEGHFPLIWVEGEISNLARPTSGHIYFSLKDDNASVRCAMFRSRNQHINFKIENGQQVLARAKVSLYEGRGDFQLIVEHMEEAGDGALRRAYELLKKKLSAEGLFDEANKKSIPSMPTCLGIVTSATGAAIHDILTVLKRRFPVPVIIYPTEVQGKQSAPSIVQAIELANQDKRCDVLILGRGGGSLEDLWGFNEESVARAIAASEIPIISAVGHEVDFTIADFVADLRAPTPSAAAEHASPDKLQLLQTFSDLQTRAINAMTSLLQQFEMQLMHLSKRLQHPAMRLQQYAQRYDFLERQCHAAIKQILQIKSARLADLTHRLAASSPKVQCDHYQERCQHLSHRLHLAIHQLLERKKQKLEANMKNLHVISPLATLDRGYAIVSDAQNHIVQSVESIKTGDTITARVAQGQLLCDVKDIKTQKELDDAKTWMD